MTLSVAEREQRARVWRDTFERENKKLTASSFMPNETLSFFRPMEAELRFTKDDLSELSDLLDGVIRGS